MNAAAIRAQRCAAWSAFVSTIVLPCAALADELPEHHGATGIPWTKLIFSTINLAIFLFIVARMIGKANLPEWFAARRRRIADALAEAERARHEAEALRAEWQRRLDSLGAELEAMSTRACASIASARKSAEAIHRDAQRTAESEIRSAQEALRAEVAAQALAIAERLAPQRLTPADQQRFVTEFVAEVNR